jgi:putative transposase
MPQSLSQVILHIVFSTKDRRPWLDPAMRPRMHAYLATVCRDCECEAYRVGGAADHVHLAARLARTITQAELLEKIKKTSSAGCDYKRVSLIPQGLPLAVGSQDT